MIFLVIKMALIVWACETGKNQAQEIRTTIHGVLNRTSDGQIKDEVIKVQFNLYIFLITCCMLIRVLYIKSTRVVQSSNPGLNNFQFNITAAFVLLANIEL